MKTVSLIICALGLLAASVFAQSYNLDDFNVGTATGYVDTNTSWNGQATLSGGALVVTANNDSGWTYTFPTPVDFSSFSNLAITAQVDSGNFSPTLSVTFADDSGSGFQTFTVNTSLFTSTMTTVNVPVSWTIDSTIIASWNIGGGQTSPGTLAFRMSFDNLALNTGAPVPEPSTYALIAGCMALGIVAWRRRNARA